ncbi:MAG: Choline-sulfatase, partial [uncultured Thermomicrobiales bacterium]
WNRRISSSSCRTSTVAGCSVATATRSRGPPTSTAWRRRGRASPTPTARRRSASP